MVVSYAKDYCSLLERSTDVLSRLGAEASRLVRNAEVLAQLVSPLIDEFMLSLSVDRIPHPMKGDVRECCQRLVYYGLLTHCILFDSPYRIKHNLIDTGALFEQWVVKSLTANPTLRSYDRDNYGYPSAVFDKFYAEKLDPLQRSIGLGWWRRRIKNYGRFKNFFASGVLLGMLHDMAAKKASES